MRTSDADAIKMLKAVDGGIGLTLYEAVRGLDASPLEAIIYTLESLNEAKHCRGLVFFGMRQLGRLTEDVHD